MGREQLRRKVVKRRARSAPPAARRRRGPALPAALSRPDLPWTMKLPDGRTVVVEVPGRWISADRDGTPAFTPPAVAFLDRVRSLFLSTLDRAPSPGYLTRLREGLGLTQAQLGRRLHVDKLTVSRWERGVVRPSAVALRAIDGLRRAALRRGAVQEG